ncbi:hypothetical protein QUC31_016060 [Theobroma cacao]
MPSLQTALPPELANNVIRLYRECLRRAKYIGHKNNLEKVITEEKCRNIFNTSERNKDEDEDGCIYYWWNREVLLNDDKTLVRVSDIVHYPLLCCLWLAYSSIERKNVVLWLAFTEIFGVEQHNTALVVDMVRQQFKKHMHETDPEKIQKLKDDAARGLINHILYESEQMSGRKFSKSS